MLKVVGIVGYQGSGKTTLTRALAGELADRGHQVAVIKHSSHQLDLPGKDTATLGEVVSQVGFISARESAVFWKKPLSLEDIIPYLDADIILVEGFKREKTIPKIVCLRERPDDADRDRPEDLLDGLAICVVGPADQMGEIADRLRTPSFDWNEVGTIADLVEEKAFKLPNLDCGGCGHERCYDLAREIVAGRASVEDCISLEPALEIKIDGQPMPMNPFISGIVRNTILGMLSSLKGFKKGEIEINL
jgi:molybdopterin-guanine dinucleotide biosynthesis protein B